MSRLIVLIIALVALIAWPRYLGFHHSRSFHVHEHFHYTLTSKYFDELGYYGLYPAAIAAGRENGSEDVGAVSRLRDQRTYELVSVEQAESEMVFYQVRFSPERWQQFKKDVDVFDQLADGNKWKRLVADKGLNASPVWVMVGQFFSSKIDFGEKGFTRLAQLDLYMLLVAAFAVLYAFGPKGIALFAILFGFNPLGNYAFNGGAFLRYDWLLALIIAASAMKKKQYFVFGLFAGYATMVRVFPVFFIFPVVVSGCYFLIRDRVCYRRYISAGVGVLLAVVVLLSLSSASLGSSAWKEWWNKIEFHSSDISPKRIGLLYALVYQGERYKSDLKFGEGANGRLEFEARKIERAKILWPWFLFVKAGALCALGALVIYRRVALLTLVGLGGLLISVFLSPADYYFSFYAVCGVCLWPFIEKKNEFLIAGLLLLIIPLGFSLDKSGLILEFKQFVLSAYTVVTYFMILCLVFAVSDQRKFRIKDWFESTENAKT